MKAILAIDHGTSGCKTALMSVHGELIGLDSDLQNHDNWHGSDTPKIE